MITAIALGSNLGDREGNLHEAVRRMGALGRVVRHTTVTPALTRSR